MTTPWLLFTCGYPFSGKSTLAKSMAEVLDLSLVSVDEHLDFNRSDSITPPMQHDWLHAYKRALDETEVALESGKSVIFDSVGHTYKNRWRLRRLAGRKGASPLLIWLDVSPAEAHARVRRNAIRPLRPQVPAESFDQIVREFEVPTADEPLVRYHPDIAIRAWIEDTLRPFLAG